MDAADDLNYEAAMQAEADALREFRRLPYDGRIGDTISNIMLADSIVKAIVQCEEARSKGAERDRRRRGKQELAERKRRRRKQQRSRRSGLSSDAAVDASPAVSTAFFAHRSGHHYQCTREPHHPVFFSTAQESLLPSLSDTRSSFAADASSPNSNDELNEQTRSSTALFPLMPPSSHMLAVKSFLNDAAVLTLVHHMCVHSKRLFHRYNEAISSVNFTRAFNSNPKDKLAKYVAGVGMRSDKIGDDRGFGGMGVGCQVVLHEGGFVSVRSYQVGLIIPSLNTTCTN